jgi:hypothetical protein
MLLSPAAPSNSQFELTISVSLSTQTVRKRRNCPLVHSQRKHFLKSVEDLRCFCGQRKVFVLPPSSDPLSSVVTSTYSSSRISIYDNEPNFLHLKRRSTNWRLKFYLPCSSGFRVSNLQSPGVSDAIDPLITDIKLCQHLGRWNPKPNTTN